MISSYSRFERYNAFLARSHFLSTWADVISPPPPQHLRGVLPRLIAVVPLNRAFYISARISPVSSNIKRIQRLCFS
jgi:hypothetical protein